MHICVNMLKCLFCERMLMRKAKSRHGWNWITRYLGTGHCLWGEGVTLSSIERKGLVSKILSK